MKVKELRMLCELFFKVIYQHFFYASYSSRAIFQNTQFNTLFRRLFLKVIQPNSCFFATLLLDNKVKDCQVISSKIANFCDFRLFFPSKLLCFPTKNCLSCFLYCLRMSLSRAKKLLPKIIIILKGNYLFSNKLSYFSSIILIILYSWKWLIQ